MVQIIDHLGTMNVKDGYKNDQTIEEWYDEYIERTQLLPPAMNELQWDTLDVDLYRKDFQDQEIDIQLANNLCGICQTLANALTVILPDMKEGADPKLAQQYSSFHEFDTLYRAGCHFCGLLMSLVKTDMLYFLKTERRLRYLKKQSAINLVLKEEMSKQKNWRMWITLPGIETPKTINDYDLTVARVEDMFFSTNRVPLSIAAVSENAIAAALDLASQWLTNCLESHGHICNTNAAHQIPTRLIAVNETPIRLVKLGGTNTTPQYTTLSHSWGGLDFLKLTSDSLDSFMKEVPFDKLTKTFQDAINITQRLGIDYLWIDSLCIIQDSIGDWEAESFLMSSIYGGSTLNIAAASAVDGSKGCFHELPTNRRTVRLGSTHTNDKSVPRYDLTPGRIFYEGTAGSQLASRAWALQERLLACRTIHFSKSGVFWECKLRDASDGFPEGLTQVYIPIEGHVKKNPLSKIWTHIVDHYTFCNLTYSNDRLVALSGVARAVQIENKDQYVAGMWRKDLEHQLCWTTFFTAPARSSDYRAPTWSWGSLDTCTTVGAFYGAIAAGKNDHTLLAHVDEVSVISSGKNPLGNLSSAYLKIVCPGLLSGSFEQEYNYWFGGHLRFFEVTELSDADKEMTISLDCDEVIPEMLYLLPLVKKEQPTGEMVAGLVIAPTGGPRGEFRRYGSFNKEYDHDVEEDVRSFKAFLRELKETGLATAASVCLERDAPLLEHPDEKFMITLI